VEVTGRSEDVVRFGVLLGESLLALEVTFAKRSSRSVVESGEVDGTDRSGRSVGVDEVGSLLRDVVFPFSLGVNSLKSGSDGSLNLGKFLNVSLAGILVELASGLDRLGDVLFERGLLLLESDQGSLEVVLLVNLLLELVLDEGVGQVRILLRKHLDARVLEGVDTGLKLGEVLDGDFTLVLDLISESGSFLLDSGDVSLEFTSDTLEFTNDGLLDSLSERRVLVGEDFVVVANFVENFLPSSFTKETVTLVERYLNSLVEGEGRFAGGVFDVSKTLVVV